MNKFLIIGSIISLVLVTIILFFALKRSLTSTQDPCATQKDALTRQCTADKSTLSLQINSLNTQLSTLNHQLVDLNNQLKACTDPTQIENLNQQISSLQSEKDDLTTQVNNLSNQLNDLQASLSDCNTDNLNITGSLNTCNTDNLNITGSLNTCNSEKSSIQQNLSTCNSNLVNVNKQLKISNTTVTSDIAGNYRLIILNNNGTGYKVRVITKENFAGISVIDKDGMHELLKVASSTYEGFVYLGQLLPPRNVLFYSYDYNGAASPLFSYTFTWLSWGAVWPDGTMI